MARSDYLRLRGAEIVLVRAYAHICMRPWQPDWNYQEIDKSGHAAPVQDALDIIGRAMRFIRLELR